MRYSWKKALLWAGIVVGVLVVLGAVLSAAGVIKDPEKFGKGSTKFILFAGAVAYGVSYLAQIGRRRAALGVSLGVVGLIGAIALAVVLDSALANEPLSGAEKAPLVVDGGRLVHPVLGYSVTYPGDKFKAGPAGLLASAFSKDLDVHGYVYVDEDDGRVLMILETSVAPTSRSGFQDMLRGMRRGLEQSASLIGGVAELKTVRDDMSWVDGKGESHVHLQAGKTHLHVEALDGKFGRKSRVVVVVAMTGDGDTLADVVASFHG